MGWFHKQRDPISERARTLQEQIANLEAQIAQLSSRAEEQPHPQMRDGEPNSASLRATSEPKASSPTSAPPPSSSRPADPAAGSSSQPRWRSTTLPHGPTISSHSAVAPASTEPIFEPLPSNPFKGPGEHPSPPPQKPELGVRKSDWRALWQRLKNHLGGPTTSNPKLVNYLAAGSVQGLRPLRYEKRVARNRFIFWAFVLCLVLWWLIVIFIKR